MSPKKSRSLTTIDDRQYILFVQEIKSNILSARIRAAKSVSHEQIELYWRIGQNIVDRQEKLGWGKSVVEQLSNDLKKDFSTTSGFSVQNLWWMRQFYMEYRNHENLLQVAREIPWFSNVTIFSKIKGLKEREYYLTATAELGWSRNVLLNQIKADAYKHHRLAKKQHNFEKALPEHMAEQADKAMKDVYMLDFLGITKATLERQIENKMVHAIKEVLLELGYGFSFIGNQYKVKLKDKEYFIDLLFYHRRLQCLVAIELKAGAFEPEYAGKMNFYLNLLDDHVREAGENPSIGIILCAEKDHLEVEYALRGINKPVGVSEYKLTKNLPQELRDKLPGVDKLKKEIMRELKS